MNSRIRQTLNVSNVANLSQQKVIQKGINNEIDVLSVFNCNDCDNKLLIKSELEYHIH